MNLFALSIRTRLILGFFLMAGCFVAVAALAVYHGARASEAETRGHQAWRIISASDDMMQGATAMQAGLRGYLLTGAVDELEAYRLGTITFEQALAYAHELSTHDAGQRHRLEHIRELGRRLINELEQLRTLRDKGPTSPAPSAAPALVGQADSLLQAIQATHSEFKHTEQRLLGEHASVAGAQHATANAVLLGGSALALLAGLAVAALLARAITRPVEEAWADAKETAGFKTGAARTHFGGDSFTASLTGIRHLQHQLSESMEELRRTRDQAQHASEAKSRFVANISHELRSPLNGILGVLQLLNRSSLTQYQRNSVNRAEMAARALLGVLNDVLDFSKVEAGMMRLDPHPFEFDDLLRDTSIIFAGALAGKAVDFRFDLDEQLAGQVLGDDLRLRQVLINLGTNAIKFTEQGEVVVSLRQVAASERDVTVEIAVQDSGIGIAPEHRDRLFKEFGQADASTTRRYGGTGLGLVLCHKLVKLMGGELQVDSEPGRGSRFSFQLQLPRVGPPREPAAATQGLRVLLACGGTRDGEAYGRYARQLGWTLTQAQDARQTLALSASDPGRFDVAFLDWKFDDERPLALAARAAEQLTPAGCAVVVMGPVEGLEHFSRLDEARGHLIGAYLTLPATAGMFAAAAAEAQGNLSRQADESALAGPSLPLAGLRLLLAEDNETNQFVASELLTGAGATIDIAGDGLEAIEKLERGLRYDAILMDVQMPRLDGMEATRRIRRLHGRRSAIPIIAMTANAGEADRHDCFSAGLDDHVAKPFVVDELIAVLQRHTSERHSTH